MRRLSIVFAAPLLACFLTASLALAEGEPTIIAEDSGLIIEGNKLVYPSITENQRLGTITLVWSDGSGRQETIENARPEDIKPKWINVKTHRPSDDFTFRSKEYTDKLITWWNKGGRGRFMVSDNHTLVPIGSSPNPKNKEKQNPKIEEIHGPTPYDDDTVTNVPRVP